MTLNGFYVPRHWSQYDPSQTPVTHRSGCTWTSATVAADAATGGRVKRTPDQVHALVPVSQESNPATPGWSLPDARTALAKLVIPSTDITGDGWAAVEAAHAAGKYLLIQGDSDRFGNNTCSGTFDGLHCIGAHPGTRTTPDGVEWWIDDPICPTGRWELVSVLSSYARKLLPTVRALVLTNPVPKAPTRYRVVVTGPTKLYNRVGGTPIGAVSKASYTCTRLKYQGVYWYRIVEGKRTGQALKPGRYTRARIIG